MGHSLWLLFLWQRLLSLGLGTGSSRVLPRFKPLHLLSKALRRGLLPYCYSQPKSSPPALTNPSDILYFPGMSTPAPQLPSRRATGQRKPRRPGLVPKEAPSNCRGTTTKHSRILWRVRESFSRMNCFLFHRLIPEHTAFLSTILELGRTQISIRNIQVFASGIQSYNHRRIKSRLEFNFS